MMQKPFRGIGFVRIRNCQLLSKGAVRGNLSLGLGFGLLLLALALLRLVLDVLIVDVHSLIDLGTQSSVVVNAAERSASRNTSEREEVRRLTG